MMKLTKSQYCQAVGLFELAKQHHKKCEEFETALNELVGDENGSHLSDAIYDTDSTIDYALKCMKIEKP